MKKSAIIIGSGIAGIACAIRLSVQGYQVTVFEKNNYPGGKIASLTKSDYQFDAGPSLFTQPENIEELFTLTGENIKEYFSYEKIPITCKYFYEDGAIINAYNDVDSFAKELQDQFGEKIETVTKYLACSQRLYDNIGTIFLNHSLHKWKTWFNRRIFKALRVLKPAYLFKTLNNYNEQFANPRTIQLFNRYATYNGSDPYKAPAMLSLIPHLEHNKGIFYPKGGMINITNALYKLALKKGVKFNFDTKVEKIFYKNKVIEGVIASGETFLSNTVVSNMDIYFTYQNLLNNDIKAKNILQQERSSSALIFYWGIKNNFSQLQLHNIFFSKDYKKEFESIFNQGNLHDDPTVYINITAKMEKFHAPSGCENWFVMINVPANKNQDWDALKIQARKNIISKLNRILQIDIEPLIEVEAFLDPVLLEKNTLSFMGSLYGTSSNSTLSAFLRHPNFDKRIKGLYFCGGSVHPGGGIPLCLKSAKIVSELVQQEF